MRPNEFITLVTEANESDDAFLDSVYVAAFQARQEAFGFAREEAGLDPEVTDLTDKLRSKYGFEKHFSLGMFSGGKDLEALLADQGWTITRQGDLGPGYVGSMSGSSLEIEAAKSGETHWFYVTTHSGGDTWTQDVIKTSKALNATQYLNLLRSVTGDGPAEVGHVPLNDIVSKKAKVTSEAFREAFDTISFNGAGSRQRTALLLRMTPENMAATKTRWVQVYFDWLRIHDIKANKHELAAEFDRIAPVMIHVAAKIRRLAGV